MKALLFKARDKIKEYRRVLKLTKKPSKSEFYTIVKVSAVGMVIIGMIGFTINLLKALIVKGF